MRLPFRKPETSWVITYVSQAHTAMADYLHSLTAIAPVAIGLLRNRAFPNPRASAGRKTLVISGTATARTKAKLSALGWKLAGAGKL